MSRVMDFERPAAWHATPNVGATNLRSWCEPTVDAIRLAAADSMTAARAPRTVLLADDSAVLRVVLSMMIESLGMRVVLAEDGRQALQRIDAYESLE